MFYKTFHDFYLRLTNLPNLTSLQTRKTLLNWISTPCRQTSPTKRMNKLAKKRVVEQFYLLEMTGESYQVSF